MPARRSKCTPRVAICGSITWASSCSSSGSWIRSCAAGTPRTKVSMSWIMRSRSRRRVCAFSAKRSRSASGQAPDVPDCRHTAAPWRAACAADAPARRPSRPSRTAACGARAARAAGVASVMSEISRMRPPAGSSGLAPMLTQRSCAVAGGIAQLPLLGSRGRGQALRLDLAPDASHAVGAQQLERRRVAFQHAARQRRARPRPREAHRATAPDAATAPPSPRTGVRSSPLATASSVVRRTT